MDFDEYDYLEKAVEVPNRKEDDHRSSRHHRDKDGGGGDRKPRDEVRNGERDESGRRERSDRREKERPRSGRDAERDRDRERDPRGRDREKERGKDREKERDRGREREGEREKGRERERERSRSRSVRHDKEVEVEMERAKSRERVMREKELEREARDRDSRRFKEKKAVEPEVDPERDQRTVFAYQMPLKATERDVYDFFSKAGKVRDVRLIMDRNSRRSKGVGYIEFYDSVSVPMAIAMCGQQLFGQPVMVKPSEAEKNLVQSTATGSSTAGGAAVARKIYVGNLHFNITEDQLRKVSIAKDMWTSALDPLTSPVVRNYQTVDPDLIFEPFGTVELVQLPLDLETGQCKGYGFIQFAEVENAKASLSLNGKLDIAGRVIKISAVTDQIGLQDSGTNVADFDDDDGGGLSLNARARALLMQKLDRTGTASSIAESLTVPMLNGTLQSQNPLSFPINGQAVAPAAFPGQLAAPLTEPIGEPSEYILLKNMFDPSTETDPDFALDIKEDVEEECSKFGPVKHIYVDKNSNGHVYLQFDSVAAAGGCQRAMHMRWFARRSISATYMRPHEFEAKVNSGH